MVVIAKDFVPYRDVGVHIRQAPVLEGFDSSNRLVYRAVDPTLDDLKEAKRNGAVEVRVVEKTVQSGTSTRILEGEYRDFGREPIDSEKAAAQCYRGLWDRETQESIMFARKLKRPA